MTGRFNAKLSSMRHSRDISRKNELRKFNFYVLVIQKIM